MGHIHIFKICGKCSRYFLKNESSPQKRRALFNNQNTTMKNETLSYQIFIASNNIVL
jgi:hypothetical protein